MSKPANAQAFFLQELHNQQPGVWRTIPERLNTAGLLTADGRPFNVKSINHWKARTNSRLIPDSAMKIVCAAYAGDDPGKTATLLEKLISQMRQDGHGGDFWVCADAVLKNLKLAKLVFPPFTWKRPGFKPEAGEVSPPFNELWLSRLRDFSGHLITSKDETRIGKILDDMIASRHTAERLIGFGLLSSIERLTLLEPLHTPIRVGINAVLVTRGKVNRPEAIVNCIKRFLCGMPIGGKGIRAVAFGAKHEVGFSHLTHMYRRKLWPELTVTNPPIDILQASQYVDKLIRTSDVPYFAVADEVTCLAIMKEIDDRKLGKEVRTELVFSLASLSTVQSEKTQLPEYLMSILIPRAEGSDARSSRASGYSFLKDALWMLLQGDVELFAQSYAELCHSLADFASKALPGPRRQEAAPWAEYTLRLHKTALARYVDHQLPWRPILERALELYDQSNRR